MSLHEKILRVMDHVMNTLHVMMKESVHEMSSHHLEEMMSMNVSVMELMNGNETENVSRKKMTHQL